MKKYDKLNAALSDLNDIKSTYDFLEWGHYSKKHALETKENINEIKTACEEALREIDVILGGVK